MAPRDGTDGKLVTISGGRQHAAQSSDKLSKGHYY